MCVQGGAGCGPKGHEAHECPRRFFEEMFARNPKPETRNPDPDTRNTKHETRNTRPETRNPKPETRNPKPETRDPRPETRDPKPETRNPKPETRDPRPETRHLKPNTPNSKPNETRNPKLAGTAAFSTAGVAKPGSEIGGIVGGADPLKVVEPELTTRTIAQSTLMINAVQTLHQKNGTLQPKPGTSNPEPTKTLHLKP